jgi:hypothetical protein
MEEHMTRKTLALAGSVLAAATLAWLTACGPTESDETPACTGGKDCVCDGENCTISCDGDSKSDCKFKCKGGATCDFTCEGGNCSMDCVDGSTCTLDCSGGGCATTAATAASVTVTCAGNGCGVNCGSSATTCAIQQCTSTCALNCGGASGCTNSCDVMAACTTTN